MYIITEVRSRTTPQWMLSRAFLTTANTVARKMSLINALDILMKSCRF